ncbi:MAG: Type 1 glutamine amidotransferase-like domain-containing protein [Opitutaceae bacterium]
MRRIFVALLLLWSAAAAPCSAAVGPVFVRGGNSMGGALFAEALRPALRESFHGRGRVALLLDAVYPDDRAAMEARLVSAFRDLGAAAESLHRLDPAARRARLAVADGIFIVGGETFVLLATLHREGLLEVIRARVRAGVPYAGSSAGANVAGIVIGTTNDFPVAEIPSRTALGLVPVSVNPHHPPASAAAEFRVRAGKIRSYLRYNPGETVLGIADASMVRWRDEKLTLIAGAGWLYRKAGERELRVGEPVSDLGK